MRNLDRNSDRGAGQDLRPVLPRNLAAATSGVVNMPRLLAGRSLAVTRERWRLSMPRLGRGSPAQHPDGRESVQPAHHGSARSYAESGSGQICGLFAVDIATFSGRHRDDDIQLYMHGSLYRMLETAFAQSDVSWADCSHEDRGDGVLVVARPTIAPGRLLPIPDRLRVLIRHHNRISCDAARIQLRIAIHFGPVHHDGHGIIGGDVNLLFRLLDARHLKRQLADSGADIALITSDYFYTNLVCRQPSIMDPTLFKAVNIQVKETRTRAWVYLPGTPQPTARVL
jgi:hypothetical protein